MKKLLSISNKIKNNTYSYTGKGAFETIALKYKDDIINWLENLVSLQEQMQYLEEKEHIQYQKRNYIRILTKLFPNEYQEFTSINILIRDASVIAKYYQDEFNTSILYEMLKLDKYLKYPGRYDKFVSFDIFQKFLMMYKDELFDSLNYDNSMIENTTQEDIEKEVIEDIKENNENKKEDIIKPKTDTNWLNLLVGK